MSTQLDKDITKGNIADFARNIAHLQNVSDKELAEILKEIADLLHPKESKCLCACHDNILKKPYGHDTKCCDWMNGYVESEEDILNRKPIEDKDLPPLPEELIDWTVKEAFEAINAIIRFLNARK